MLLIRNTKEYKFQILVNRRNCRHLLYLIGPYIWMNKSIFVCPWCWHHVYKLNFTWNFTIPNDLDTSTIVPWLYPIPFAKFNFKHFWYHFRNLNMTFSASIAGPSISDDEMYYDVTVARKKKGLREGQYISSTPSLMCSSAWRAVSRAFMTII